MVARIEADCRAFFGKSGRGKTALALHQLKKFSRVLIHDVRADAKCARGAVVTDDPRVLAAAILAKGPVRVCWRGIATMGPEAAFEFANRTAWAAGNVAVFWDDVDACMSARRVPFYAYQMLNAGRHRGIAVLASARRPYNTPRDLTAACTRIMATTITSGPDIDYLAGFMGEDARKLPFLDKFVFLDWTEDGTRLRKSLFS